MRADLNDSGSISTSFPGGRSGIFLKKIQQDSISGALKLDVTFDLPAKHSVKKKRTTKRRKK
jgi:hypothetical protein